MTKFIPGTKYIANGAYAFDGQTKDVYLRAAGFNRRGKPVLVFEGFDTRKLVHEDEAGEYAWLGAVWSVHSANVAQPEENP
jgi:hypothetical protein